MSSYIPTKEEEFRSVRGILFYIRRGSDINSKFDYASIFIYMNILRSIPHLYNRAFEVYQEGKTSIDFTDEVDYTTFQFIIHFVTFCNSMTDEDTRIDWLKRMLSLEYYNKRNSNIEEQEETRKRLCHNIYFYTHLWGCDRLLWTISQAFPDIQFPDFDSTPSNKKRSSRDDDDDDDMEMEGGENEVYKRLKR